MKKVIILVLALIISVQFVVPAFAATQSHIQYYSIKRGDTLHSIAKQFETTVVRLLDLNPRITPDNLSIGQRITVPSREPLYIYHVVQRKETLRSISKQYNIALNDLKEANELKNNKVNEGQTIRIPVDKIVADKPEAPKNEAFVTYVVKSGDTYWSLANKYKTTVEKLYEINHKVPAEMLVVGATIRIPVSTTEIKHTIEIGDTLFKIAKQYNVTLAQLMDWNELTDSELIHAGQKLTIVRPTTK